MLFVGRGPCAAIIQNLFSLDRLPVQETKCEILHPVSLFTGIYQFRLNEEGTPPIETDTVKNIKILCSFSHHTLLRFKLMCIITITLVQYITQETQETYLEQKKPFIMIKWIKWIDTDLCGALGNAGKWNFKRVRWVYNSKPKTFLVRWMLIKITCSKHLTLQSIPAWHRGKSFATTTLCMVKIKI